MRKRILIVLTVVGVLLCILGVYLLIFKGMDRFQVNSIQYESTLDLTNIDIDQLDTYAYRSNGVTFSTNQPGYNGSNTGLKISSPNVYNDAGFSYTFTGLAPREVYELSAYMKGENIAYNPDDSTIGIGGVLYATGSSQYSSTTLKEGNTNWTKLTFLAQADGNGEITMRMGLGYSYNTSKGTVYIDDIHLRSLGSDYVKVTSSNKKVNLYYYASDVAESGISNAKLTSLANHLGEVATAYEHLVDNFPKNKSSIDIIYTNANTVWGLSLDNRISVNQKYAVSDLKSEMTQDLPSYFGLYHELSHCFDHASDRKWVFDAEFWANMKMNYLFEYFDNFKIYFNNDGQIYTQSTVKNYYKKDYDAKYKSGTYTNDGLTYLFLLIVDQIGWEPFEDTFRWFNDLDVEYVPTDNRMKFELFIDKLTKFSGKDVKSMFSTSDWNTAINYLGDEEYIPIKSFNFTNYPTELTVGDNYQPQFSVYPSNHTEPIFITSSDTEVIEIGSNYNLIAKKAGTVTIEYLAGYSNIRSKHQITVTNPVAFSTSVSYSTTQLTNQHVNVTIRGNYDLQSLNGWTLSSDKRELRKTYYANTEETITVRNTKGESKTVKISISNIDKEAPVLSVSYQPNTITKDNVVVTITSNEKMQSVTGWTLSDDQMTMTKTYTNNQTENVTVEDLAGNVKTVQIKVTNIDKEPIRAQITYTTLKPTNQNVIATITFNKSNVTITNNNGKNTYTFTQNGTFTFTYRDEAGNTGSLEAKVQNIDKEPIKSTIEYSELSQTTDPVTATIRFNKENVTITNNNGKNTYTFTQNGTFTFLFEDEAGNTGSQTAVVGNILNKYPVNAHITYSTTDWTNQDVIATISFEEEDVEILNNGGKDTYTFTQNGEFIFEYQGKNGIKGRIQAIVENIDKVPPTLEVTAEQDGGKWNILVQALEESSTIEEVKAAQGIQNKEYFHSHGDEISFEKNAVVAINYLISSAGNYTFYVKDSAQNETIEIINLQGTTINSPPDIQGVIPDHLYYEPVRPIVVDTDLKSIELLKNGEKVEHYVNGQTIDEPGKYTLTAIDEAGNKTTVSFEISYEVVDEVPDTNANVSNIFLGIGVSVIIVGLSLIIYCSRSFIKKIK